MKRMLESAEVLENLMNEFISDQEASEFMNRQDIQDFLRNTLSRFDAGIVVLDESDKETLKNLVSIAYHIYTYSDVNPGLDDPEYDKLYDLLVLNGEEEFISLPSAREDDEEHHAYTSLRGTLSKVYYLTKPDDSEKTNKTRRSLDDWVKQTEDLYYRETGKRIDLKQESVYVFPKWDGISAIFQFKKDGTIDRVLTRGYTKFNTAENISHHFKDLTRPIEPNRKYGLKTEILVSEESLQSYNTIYEKDYKQSRSIASGIINSREADERDKYLIVMQLRYMDEKDEIEKLCPEVFDHPHIRCKLGEYDKIEAFAEEHHYTEGLRCDGAVIYIIDPEIQKVLGRKNDRNRFEVAYKFTEESAYSKVEDIKFQTGLFGRIAPVVKFKPVKMKGNTISSASLGSIERMEQLQLAKGDEIKILYDIIPYVTTDSTCYISGNKPIRPPKVCPSCGKPLVREGSILSCKNLDCDWRKKGKILNYFVKMNIQNISFATVDVLYERGILQSIKDIYKLKKHEDEILGIPKFGYTKYRNILDEIERKREVSESLLLGSIGIDGIASQTFEKVFSVFTIDELLDIVEEGNSDLLSSAVPGIGHKKAITIIDGMKENMKTIKFLLKELKVYHEINDAKFKVCFTKVRDKEIEKLVERYGGKVVNSVTSDTTYLVVPDLEVSSSKTKSAKKNGVPIVTIAEISDIIKSNYSAK